jgi:hypothetical protein
MAALLKTLGLLLGAILVLAGSLTLVIFLSSSPNPLPPPPPAPAALVQAPSPPPAPMTTNITRARIVPLPPRGDDEPVNVPADWGKHGFLVDRVRLGERHGLHRVSPPLVQCSPLEFRTDLFYQGADVAPIMARHPRGSTLIVAFEEGTWRNGGGAPGIRVIEWHGSGGIPSGERNQSIHGNAEGTLLGSPSGPCARLRHPKLAWSRDGTTAVLAVEEDEGRGGILAYRRNLREGRAAAWHGPVVVRFSSPPHRLVDLVATGGRTSFGLLFGPLDREPRWRGNMGHARHHSYACSVARGPEGNICASPRTTDAH